MLRPLLFLALLSGYACSYTTDYPVADPDYAVYESVINEFSYCDDSRISYRHGQQLIVRQNTAVPHQYSFDFDFAHAQQALRVQLQVGGSFYEKPDWAAFLSSLDNTRFPERSIGRPLHPACRSTIVWSGPQIDQHLMQGTDGYRSLADTVSRFGGIVALSAVAYSPDGQKAICYYEHIWGYKEGYGKLVFLENTQSVWTVIGVAALWIA